MSRMDQMNESELQTRIKVKTSFQDSYLEERDRSQYGKQNGMGQQQIKEQIRQAELELEMLKATHQYLTKQIGKKAKMSKEALEVTAREFQAKAQKYASALRKLTAMAPPL